MELFKIVNGVIPSTQILIDYKRPSPFVSVIYLLFSTEFGVFYILKLWRMVSITAWISWWKSRIKENKSYERRAEILCPYYSEEKVADFTLVFFFNFDFIL